MGFPRAWPAWVRIVLRDRFVLLCMFRRHRVARRSPVFCSGRGRTACVAMMLAVVLAFVPAAVLLARHRSGARKMAIPFAPFLAAGAVVALFVGDRLLDVYLRTLT